MRRWFWVLDVVVVLAFVVIGREDHGFVSDASDHLRVAAPFLLGLGAAVVATRAWRSPLSWKTGLLLALGTLIIGMVLRRFVWDAGTARAFVAITGGFFIACMVGWRLAWTGVRKLVSSRRAAGA